MNAAQDDRYLEAFGAQRHQLEPDIDALGDYELARIWLTVRRDTLDKAHDAALAAHADLDKARSEFIEATQLVEDAARVAARRS